MYAVCPLLFVCLDVCYEFDEKGEMKQGKRSLSTTNQIIVYSGKIV